MTEPAEKFTKVDISVDSDGLGSYSWKVPLNANQRARVGQKSSVL